MMELSRVAIRQGSFALSNIDLSIPAGAYAVLMGPTGCGKTSILEAICGLRRIESGSIWLDGTDVTRWPSAQREIGYVPQDRAVFPTMRVDRQIEYGLLVRGARPSLRRQRVEELAELTGISSLLHRFPKGLSGGELQRVALARALSFRPRLVCLDEPLSALDDQTRCRVAGVLKDIHQKEKVTVLHITHNVDDALRLATLNFRFIDQQIKRVENATSE